MLSKFIRYQAKESFKHNWRRLLQAWSNNPFFFPPDAGRGGVWDVGGSGSKGRGRGKVAP